ncbi:unnamed protein product [Chondrus crispus]|uniref:Uncharacterized protein n=1 Tax=Chondrus crispus TaxID=2769 RepID=R7QKL5_CHOCR|nr:unnamed protein product [Chondrus crispus]CDF39052.1 unnamed protein product [Chondrus crispus]|eukprot:XP_005718963.1 unnamed protein product [Chondrus crispus]
MEGGSHGKGLEGGEGRGRGRGRGERSRGAGVEDDALHFVWTAVEEAVEEAVGAEVVKVGSGGGPCGFLRCWLSRAMVRAHFFFNFWAPIEHRIKTISPPVLPMLVRASSTWVAPTCTRASKHHALLLLPNLPSRSAPHHYQGELDCPLASNWAVCSSQSDPLPRKLNLLRQPARGHQSTMRSFFSQTCPPDPPNSVSRARPLLSPSLSRRPRTCSWPLS